jgi:hypothetical protein
MVRTGGFTYPEDLEGVDDLIAEAVQMQGALTPSGKLQLTTRTHADRVTALGLALYPRIHPQHNGRRYYAPNFLDPFESYRAATAMLGQGAQDFGA